MTTDSAARPHVSNEAMRDWLVVRAGSFVCALPLDAVVETLRPPPIRPLEGMPSFVEGAAVIRGRPTPVVGLAALLGEAAGPCSRLVTVRAADRLVALAVDAVAGLRALPDGTLPPLMQRAAGEAVTAMSTLDSELLLVLDASRLAPQDWLEAASGPADGDGR